jgi:hypothetical protein
LRGGVGTECRKLAKSALSDDQREELARPAHLHDGSSQAEHPSKPSPATQGSNLIILKNVLINAWNRYLYTIDLK